MRRPRLTWWVLFLLAIGVAAGIALTFWSPGQAGIDRREMAILNASPAALAAHHQGEAAYARRALEEAALGFRTAARLQPKSALAWYNLGIADTQISRSSEAVQALNQAVRLEPRWSSAWQTLAGALADTHDLTGAERAARRAVELDSRSAQAWLVRGHVAFLQGDQKAATEYSTRALSLDPRNPDAWLSLGDALLKSSDPSGLSRAAEAFRKAVELRPNAYTWQRLGEAQARAGRPVDAVASLRNAVKLSPRDAATAYALTQALQAAGNTAEAGREAIRARKLQEARYRLIMLERRVTQSPENADLLAELGKERMKQGDREGAMESFRHALSLRPEDPAVRQALGSLEAGAGTPEVGP